MSHYDFTLNGSMFSSLKGSAGSFVAFSGDGSHRNKAGSTNVPNDGPIPQGSYYIVERPSGGRVGPVRDFFLGRDEWFALYRIDGTIDDETFVDGVRRGLFRLHPLGPSGVSEGCIVLQYAKQFEKLRSALVAGGSSPVPGSSLRRYGTVSVI